jgi:hypothetical protein
MLEVTIELIFTFFSVVHTDTENTLQFNKVRVMTMIFFELSTLSMLSQFYYIAFALIHQMRHNWFKKIHILIEIMWPKLYFTWNISIRWIRDNWVYDMFLQILISNVLVEQTLNMLLKKQIFTARIEKTLRRCQFISQS